MIDRYTRPEMAAIWNRRAYFEFQRQVELAVVRAWAKFGKIPLEDCELIQHASFTLERIDEIEREADHETNAFVTALAESLGPESRWLHLGLTSSDVLDTAGALQLRAALDQIGARLRRVESAVAKLALKHRRTAMIGRSHGMHAEPISFGFKLAIWIAELRRTAVRLAAARDSIAVGKIAGSVGTHANVPPRVEEAACAELALGVAPVASQILQRDRHAEALCALALCASTLDKFATEIRHLQRNEVAELEEPFETSRHGSSSMPHKRNPARSERISGLARVVRANAQVGLENVALWHERDISHSSAERIVLVDSTTLVDYMLWLFAGIMEGLAVYPQRMRENLDLTRGQIFSQAAMLELVESGMNRQKAYDLVRAECHAAAATGEHLHGLLARHPQVIRHIEPERLAAVFDIERHLLHVDEAFARLGLNQMDSTPLKGADELD